MRYFVWFAYDGTNYHGWQVQPSGNSVQAELQRALGLLMRQDVEVVGAGRTDAGVHARHFAAHFDVAEALDCEQVAYRLNRILPRDIAVSRVEPVPDDWHARFSALARTYHYYIYTRKDPFVRHYAWRVPYELDYGKMNEAAAILLETEDFAAFCKAHTDVKTTICHVTEARWIQTSEFEWYFRITANRFLRNMVRAVVGTLVDVGRGRTSLHDFRDILSSGNRSNAGESMPAHALFLEDVRYE